MPDATPRSPPVVRRSARVEAVGREPACVRQTAAVHRRLRLLLALAAAAVLAPLVAACGGSAGASGPCARVVTEPLDRNSLQHVLPGAKGLHYLTDPPTSGPHQPAPPAQG